MKINKFQQIIIKFQTLLVPPPFSHEYLFIITPQEKQIKVQYQLIYTDRDSLTEDEIAEEGFSPDDNYHWEGILPEVWHQALIKMLQQTTKITPKHTSTHPNIITLQVSAEETHEGIPDNLEAWEYFIQELTQAVFELSQKEHPLEVHYVEVLTVGQTLSITLRPSFITRELSIEVSDPKKRQTNVYPWEQLKPLLKAIYLPDYDEEQAQTQQPKRPGKYIDPGEGRWYELNKSVSNPGKKYDAVGVLEKEIKKFI